MFPSSSNRLSSIWETARKGRSSPDAGSPDMAAIGHVRTITRSAGSSFYWAMRILPRERREAMFAIYAFCREVDDIADGDDPVAAKRERLGEWRTEIHRLYDGRPTMLTTRALAGPVERFALQRKDFLAIIDGMEMDLAGAAAAPSMAELEAYCARVAGAVGLLSIRAFGASGSRPRDFARALGAALQLTNILRDLRQDAALHRLYLPRELLDAHGIGRDADGYDPDATMAHSALPAVCNALAVIARRRFAEAGQALADCDRRALRPAVVMMMHYSRILDRLVAGGWRDLDRRITLAKPVKIWIAIRYGLW